MRITVLDSASIGLDLDYTVLSAHGELTVYESTDITELADRLSACHVAVLNKIRITEDVLAKAGDLRLICIAATGYDNVDVAACRARGIGVCNVAGYSTDSVAQLTLSMALSLVSHLSEYREMVTSGQYSASGKPNALTPVYHELAGKTWGIVGYGHIGERVATVARALGCRILAYKRTPVEGVECVDLDTLCRESHVISLHTPLNDGTRGLIGREQLAHMRQDAILINVARGAVVDESAVAEAILSGRLGGYGCDVYTAEPFPREHPYTAILDRPNVCLTPHMAWAAFEARSRCLREIAENIAAFSRGETRSRVDL